MTSTQKELPQYKAVNPNSTNRRENLRHARDKTPDTHNRRTFKFETRVTFKMNVPASDDPRSAIVKILKELVAELNQIDSDSDSDILP